MSKLEDHLLFLHEFVAPFETCEFIQDSTGWIVWRVATGRNMELLHLRTHVRQQGHGRDLIRSMLRAMRTSGREPYATIFGFTRVANVGSQAFYEAMGFTCTKVAGVYDDGEAILFSARYDHLLNVHRIEASTCGSD